MKRYIILTLILLFSFGCNEKPQIKLTIDMLKNATYKGIYDKPFKLTNGIYEGEPFEKDSAMRPTVTFVDSLTAFGDLDGDGIEDGVAILSENSGGSGVFIYVCVVTSKDNKPLNISTKLLDDRVQVKSVQIKSSQVILKLLTHDEQDPLCCPTLKQVKEYKLKNDILIENKQ